MTRVPPKSRRSLALRHLKNSDPIMKKVIGDVGPFSLKLESDRFSMLVRSILSQQLSTQAAKTIRGRLENITAGSFSAMALGQLEVDELRGAGVSRRKAECILALSEAAETGNLKLEHLGRYSNDKVIKKLTKLKGIGRWTAQMFLIFSLGRLDVFPDDDAGLKSAIALLYGFDQTPSQEKCLEISKCWRPYASVGTWYCWQALDKKRKQHSDKTNGFPT